VVEIIVETDLNIAYLQAELARIDLLIQFEVRRWQAAGQDMNDAYRGMYVSDGEANALLAQPPRTSWGQTVTLPPDQAQALAEATARATRQSQQVLDMARQRGQGLRLEHLGTAFGLDPFERDVLLLCLVPALDLRYERLYAYLQDHVNRKRPTVNLVLALLAEPGLQPLLLLSHFAADAPLFKYEILERVTDSGAARPLWLSQTLYPDETIVAWLLGKYQPHAALGSHAALRWPQPNQTDQLLAAEIWPHLERAAAQQPLIAFYGPDQASQQAAARLLAAQLQRPLLTVDLAAVTVGGVPVSRALRLALRDARLTGAIPYLTGWDAGLADGAPPPDLLAQVCAHPGLVLLAGPTRWQPRGMDPERERSLFWVETSRPSYAQRRTLWQHCLDQAASIPDGAGEQPMDITTLAGQFLLTAGQIRDAVASARSLAAQQGRLLHNDDLLAAARAHSSPRLAGLARHIVPHYTWSDLVLPQDQRAMLREIVAAIRGRARVLEEWGLGRKLAASRGVTILFSGQPGTGKTMAAEVIAAELGLDLYKIDLSSVVSKYIGETEKNLERIFNEAESSNAILFFDEADALFGKRSEVHDAHDRYANIEISYLLQRMEAYDGVTILATNLGANLDEAFTRRLQFAVDFPFPDEADRLRIWQTLFPAGVPTHSELDLALLARRFELAGGNIRNILVSAAYLAAADGGSMTMEHLLHGTRRELQKMGRLVDEKDLAIKMSESQPR
jgi:hypothetical protein